MSSLLPGQIRFRNVSRSFKILHERNATLKETLLRRRRISATEYWALRNVDLDIAPGEFVGIVGKNGAGKSTLLKLIAGILSPQAGTVESAGSVASMLELGAGFHPDFTGRENVYMNGAILGLTERQVDERLAEIIAFAELEDFIDMPVKTYSSGMHMRLAFSVASHVSADILLLDEVLAVGDEAFQKKCYGRIHAHRRRGGTLVFVSHDPDAIERICDRALLIIDGAVIEDGPPDKVMSRYHRELVADTAGIHPTDRAVASDDSPGSVSVDERPVIVTACRTVDRDGVTTGRFVSGDEVTIEIELFASQRMPTPNIGIMINFIEGPLCYGTNTRLDGWPIDELLGAASVRFTIPDLRLHAGQFAVTIAVSSHDESVIYQWLDRVMSFGVFPRNSGIGPVDLSGSWTIAPIAATSTRSGDLDEVGHTEIRSVP